MMNSESVVQTPPEVERWSVELSAFFDEVRQKSIVFILPALVLCAILMGSTTAMVEDINDLDRRLSLALWMLVLTVVVWILRERTFSFAAWVLVAGCLAIIFRMATWEPMGETVFLVVFPVGIATLLITRAAGAVVALFCTIIVLLNPGSVLHTTNITRGVAILGMWGVYGLLVAAISPLVTATSWAWSGYERSLLLLKQAQNFQQQYQDALKDLTDANVQLLRLNRYAQGLRLLAEEKQRVKEQFVANVSHELRAPLNMIIGFTEMILKSPEYYSWDIPPKLMADLDVIHRNSQHLSELVDDVLDLSQIEAGQMALTRESVALIDIIEAAATAVRPLFEMKKLSLTIEVPGNLPLIFCDRTRIREVLLNLLSNAGRFTEEGGVTVHAWRDGSDVVVSVIDTGVGIAPDEQAGLFKPFHQVDSSLRRQNRGTGLGLSLSKKFVELHEGKMWMESEIGHGTTISFRLPIEPYAPISVDPSSKMVAGWEFLQRTRPALVASGPIKPKIIVVEEGYHLAHLLERHMNEVEISTARDMAQAIASHAETPTQAVILNQAEVVDGLQSLTARSDLPVGVPVFVCSLPEEEAVADRLGAFAYLVKPVMPETFLKTLDSLGKKVKTVLIVDDDPDALQLYRRILAGERKGLRILRAPDGRQALEVMRSRKVDVVFMDLMMPEMNGYQVLEILNQDENLSQIPVILISARDPFGEPVGSKSLAVTCQDGLTVQELLACFDGVCRILTKTRLPADPGLTPGQPG